MKDGLILSHITKAFGQTRVLNDISLALGQGELLVLLGQSGCGKSTLLRIIAGLEEQDSGEVSIAGRRVEHLRPRDRNVALVFQNYSLYPHMSVEKNLAFPLKVAGAKKDEITSRVRSVAEMLGLTDRLHNKPAQLSGGQRQRVALGRAIIREPAIFLLDEPLSNLDADLRVRMRQEIVRLQRQVGVTMVHVTHDQVEALTMADRIALLNQGTIEQLGTPEELYKNPASLFVATFIGQPKMNTFDAVVESGLLNPLGIKVDAALRGPVVAGIRPEAVQLVPDGDLSGEITDAEYMGDHYVVWLAIGKVTLTAVAVAGEEYVIGQKVRFSIPPDEILLFDRESGKNLNSLPPR